MKKAVWKACAALAAAFLAVLISLHDAASAPPVPQRGGILKVSDRGDPPTLNCMMNPSVLVFSYASPVFNGLVMIDPTQDEVNAARVVPALAEKWNVGSDGKTYAFHLKKGVKFHDGQPFTARDVKYSLDFYADPAKSALAPMVGMMDKVEIIDDYALRVSLKYPNQSFLLYLSYPYCVMLPAHRASVSPKSPDFLVGTGPFKFKRRVPGKLWEYERNPDYFLKGLPYLDGIEIYPMPRETAVDAFCGGRLSMAGNLRYGIEVKTTLEKVKKHVPEATVKLKPVGVLRGVIFNVAGLKGRKGPWQDVRVRRAMAMVADFSGSIIAGQGSPDLGMNTGIVPPFVPTGLPWKEVEKILGIDQPMEQRIREAKKLMSEAGHPGGFKAEMISRNQPPYLRPAEFMIEGWRNHLGVQVDLKPMENAVLFPRRDSGDFDLIYDGMTGRLGGSPEESLGMFVSQAEENHGKWGHKEYDRLFGELVREMDPGRKAEKSRRMQRIFLGEVPFIINVTPVMGTAHRPNLHGHVMQTGHTGWACWDRLWIQK